MEKGGSEHSQRDRARRRKPLSKKNAFQRAAIELLSNRNPKQPLDEIAHQAGVKPQTLVRWLGEEEFRRALVERARDEIRSYLPIVKNVLVKKALINGDKECLKMVVGICGLLEPDKPSEAVEKDVTLLSDEELLERIRWFRSLYE